MKTKKVLAILLFVSISAAIIGASVYAFLQLKSNKEVFNTDLYSLIPKSSYALLEIHNANYWKEKMDTKKLLNLILPEDKVLDLALQMTDEGEVSIAFLPEGSLILKKINQLQFKQMRQDFFSACLSEFPPKTDDYKKVTIYLQPSRTSDFFCYAYHQGAFIGSYSKKTLMQAIDLFHSKQSLREDEAFNTCVESAGKNAPAVLFISEKCEANRIIPYQSWLTGDLSCENNALRFNGFVQNKKMDHPIGMLIYQNKSLPAFHPESLPEKTDYVALISTDSTSLNSLLAKQEYSNSSDSALFNSLTGEIGVIHFSTGDVIDNELAYMKVNATFSSKLRTEISSIQSKDSAYIRRINSAIYPDLLLYETTRSFGIKHLLGDLFPVDTSFVFALHEDYLLLGRNEKQIECYIEQLEIPDSIRVNPLPEEIKATMDGTENLRIFVYEKWNKGLHTSIIKNKPIQANGSLLLVLSTIPNGIYFDCIFKIGRK